MPIDAETLPCSATRSSGSSERRLNSREREVALLEAPPQDLLDEVRDIVLFRACYPRAMVGWASNPLQEVEIGFELGRASPPWRNFISIHNGVAGQCLLRAGTTAQKDVSCRGSLVARSSPPSRDGARVRIGCAIDQDPG